MNIRERWNKTTIANQLLVIVGTGAFMFTALNTAIVAFQIWLADRSNAQASDRTDRVLSNLNWMAQSMDRTIKDAEGARRVAERQSKDALDASIKAARIDQRAWVSIGQISSSAPICEVGKRFVPNYQLINTGRTPALHTALRFRVDSFALGKKPDFGTLKNVEAVSDTFGPGFFSPFRTNASSTIVTQPIHDSVINGKQIIFMYGRLDYRDTFGFGHWLRFLYEYLPRSNEFIPQYSEIDKELR